MGGMAGASEYRMIESVIQSILTNEAESHCRRADAALDAAMSTVMIVSAE